MKKHLIIIGMVLVAGAICFVFVRKKTVISTESSEASSSSIVADGKIDPTRKSSDEQPNADVRESPDAVAATEPAEVPAEEEELSETEKKELAEEKLVDAFDAETDRWMDAEKNNSPTLQEIDAFHAKFKSLPKERKDECLHRALNLIPDENVMLLVGILMDKSEDKDLVELIFNDVLNRDEEVKKPILQTIFKDKEHPCWADTAWILDVTGELPKKN